MEDAVLFSDYYCHYHLFDHLIEGMLTDDKIASININNAALGYFHNWTTFVRSIESFFLSRCYKKSLLEH